MKLRILHDQDGTELVEMALTLSILLAFVIGIMQLCLAMYYYNYVSEAAREATRFAIVRGPGCNVALAGCPVAEGDIATYVKNHAFPGIDTSKLTVTSTLPPACSGPCVRVQVQYDANLPIPFTPGLNLTLSSTSQEVINE